MISFQAGCSSNFFETAPGQRSAVGFWRRAARRSPRRPTGAAASRRRRRRFRPSGAPTALRASTSDSLADSQLRNAWSVRDLMWSALYQCSPIFFRDRICMA